MKPAPLRQAAPYAADAAICERLERRRLLAAGDPDPTFGTGVSFPGQVQLDLPGGQFVSHDMAVYGGKVLLAGSKGGGMAVVRLNVDGSLDDGGPSDSTPGDSFGNGGLFESTRRSAATSIALYDEGLIVLGLATDPNDANDDFPVARLQVNGSAFDGEFGDQGIATAAGLGSNRVNAVAVQTDGKILAVGYAQQGGDDDFAVVRYNVLGRPDDADDGDAAFDGDGVTTIGFGKDEGAAAVAVDGAGNIVLAGHTGDSAVSGQPPAADSSFAVARLLPDGSLDPTFDGDGKLIGPDSPGASEPNAVGTAVLLQPFGKVIVGGYAGPNDQPGPNNFRLARFLGDGRLDPSFSDDDDAFDGFAGANFGANDFAYDMTFGDFGGILVGGSSSGNFAVAAFTADGDVDTRFGDGTGLAKSVPTSTISTAGIATGPGRRLYVAGGTGTIQAYLDVGPIITVEEIDNEAAEAGPDAASFRVVRDEPVTGARRVFFDVSGTARKPGITFPVGRPADYSGDPDTLFPRDDSGEIPYVDIPAGASELVVTITPADDDIAEGIESAIFNVRPHGANSYDVGVPDDVTLTISDDEAPNPAVTQVFVDSTGWTDAFRSHLQNRGLGSATLGFRIPTLADQLKVLPWTNVNRVRVVFSEDVDVQAGDLRVRGVNVASYGLAAGAAGFSYDAPTFTATWTLAAAGVGADKILLDLDADAASGGVTARATGNLLDGEWNNPGGEPPEGGDVFPSGNGLAGGDFRFQLNVLPGDVNRNGGIVNSLDLQAVRLRQFTSPTSPGTPPNTYTAFHDVNGSAGIINAPDVQLVRIRQFSSLPDGTPSVAAPPRPALFVAPAGRRGLFDESEEPSQQARRAGIQKYC